MIYLLDTNTCIGYINRRSLPIFRRLSALATEDIALCDVVKFELYYGAYRSSLTHNVNEFSRVEGLQIEDWEAEG